MSRRAKIALAAAASALREAAASVVRAASRRGAALGRKITRATAIAWQATDHRGRALVGEITRSAASVVRSARRAGGALGRGRLALAAAAVLLLGCFSLLMWLAEPVETGGDPPADGEAVLFTVAPGATFVQITDTLVKRGLIRRPLLFRVYGRLRRDERNVRSGTYSLAAGSGWNTLLDALVEGRVRMVSVTIPEGFTLPQIASRIAVITDLAADTVESRLGEDSAHVQWSIPGPGLEGYLFPDTYLFASGVPLGTVVEAMNARYRRYWTPERRARAVELGLSEREVVTLASIIQAEVRVAEEMPTISAVYHNRLRIGMPLQADPTVLYALGGHRPRLLFAAIDSVAGHPYNTYTQSGLPPGPIGAPGAAALDAALHAAEVDYLYFVANPDGSHTFSRTLAEHNRATVRARRAAAAATPGGG